MKETSAMGTAVPELGVCIGDLALANPVMPASGCFGPELSTMLDVSVLGATVTKTVFAVTRPGNPAHRLTDTGYGMLNSVGIPSPGSRGFREGLLGDYRSLGVPVVVSIGGLFVEEYWAVAEDLADERIAAYEVNVSCPNLEHGGLAIGTSPEDRAPCVDLPFGVGDSQWCFSKVQTQVSLFRNLVWFLVGGIFMPIGFYLLIKGGSKTE